MLGLDKEVDGSIGHYRNPTSDGASVTPVGQPLEADLQRRLALKHEETRDPYGQWPVHGPQSYERCLSASLCAGSRGIGRLGSRRSHSLAQERRTRG